MTHSKWMAHIKKPFLEQNLVKATNLIKMDNKIEIAVINYGHMNKLMSNYPLKKKVGLKFGTNTKESEPIFIGRREYFHFET